MMALVRQWFSVLETICFHIFLELQRVGVLLGREAKENTHHSQTGDGLWWTWTPELLRFIIWKSLIHRWRTKVLHYYLFHYYILGLKASILPVKIHHSLVLYLLCGMSQRKNDSEEFHRATPRKQLGCKRPNSHRPLNWLDFCPPHSMVWLYWLALATQSLKHGRKSLKKSCRTWRWSCWGCWVSWKKIGLGGTWHTWREAQSSKGPQFLHTSPLQTLNVTLGVPLALPFVS